MDAPWFLLPLAALVSVGVLLWAFGGVVREMEEK